MFDFYSELRMRAKYEAGDNFYCLDTTQYVNQGQESKPKPRPLRHGEIVHWLDQEPSGNAEVREPSLAKAGLRVLVCVAADHIDTDVVIVPVTQEVYHRIEQTFNIDAAVLGYIIAEGVTVFEFEAFNGGHGLLAILKRQHIVITHDATTSSTNVLARAVRDHDAKALVDLLANFCTETSLVTAILVSWMTITLQYRVRAIQDIKRALLSIERETGLHSEFENKHARLERKDLLILTQQLMRLRNASADTALQFHMDVLEILSDWKQHFVIESLIRQPAPCRRIRIQMSQIRSQIKNSQIIRHEVDRRADVLLQTTYNLIAQRDNDVNVRIAMATQEDAAAQKRIAEDMSDITKRTYRDSANMSAMTLINLCCLPGTFAATFFSTGFFDFYYNRPSSIVSPWIWLYWVIVAALTAVLYVIWTIMSRNMQQDLKKGRSIDIAEEPADNTRSKDLVNRSSITSATEATVSDAGPGNRSREDTKAPDTVADPSFEPTWLPAMLVGGPLDSDQCPICFARTMDDTDHHRLLDVDE